MNEQKTKYEKSSEDCKHPLNIWVREESKEGWSCGGCGKCVSYRELGSDYTFSLRYYLEEEINKKQEK